MECDVVNKMFLTYMHTEFEKAVKNGYCSSSEAMQSRHRCLRRRLDIIKRASEPLWSKLMAELLVKQIMEK